MQVKADDTNGTSTAHWRHLPRGCGRRWRRRSASTLNVGGADEATLEIYDQRHRRSRRTLSVAGRRADGINQSALKSTGDGAGTFIAPASKADERSASQVEALGGRDLTASTYTDWRRRRDPASAAAPTASAQYAVAVERRDGRRPYLHPHGGQRGRATSFAEPVQRACASQLNDLSEDASFNGIEPAPGRRPEGGVQRADRLQPVQTGH